jgi:hypothetical protein
MAETLSNINSFLAAVSRQSAINSSSDVSAYKKETVVINAGNRQYDDIIKFTNKDNVYNGTFITSAGNIVDIIQGVTNLSSNISSISAYVSSLGINLNNKIENTANSTYTSCFTDISSASKNYTDVAIDNKLSSNSSAISDLTNRLNFLSNKILNKENDIISGNLQPNLNAQFLNGMDLSDIINRAVNTAQTTLSAIDCGRIGRI